MALKDDVLAEITAGRGESIVHISDRLGLGSYPAPDVATVVEELVAEGLVVHTSGRGIIVS